MFKVRRSRISSIFLGYTGNILIWTAETCGFSRGLNFLREKSGGKDAHHSNLERIFVQLPTEEEKIKPVFHPVNWVSNSHLFAQSTTSSPNM